MKKYIYQKFLLNCDYQSIKTTDFPVFEGNIESVVDYRYDYCLFDVGREVIRKISAADIDEQVDTEEDWERLLKVLNAFDAIVLYDYNISSSNPIIQSYRQATIRSYLYRLQGKVYLA